MSDEIVMREIEQLRDIVAGLMQPDSSGQRMHDLDATMRQVNARLDEIEKDLKASAMLQMRQTSQIKQLVQAAVDKKLSAAMDQMLEGLTDGIVQEERRHKDDITAKLLGMRNAVDEAASVAKYTAQGAEDTLLSACHSFAYGG